jgi:hypothetical protein
MPDDKITTTIERAVESTIQSRATQALSGNVFLVNWLARGYSVISPWWSPARDRQLREFVKKSDHLAGAVYTMQAKMTAIPFRIEPRDRTIQEHVWQAEQLTDLLLSASEFGEGWQAFFGKWVEDNVVTDNGAFAEIIGPGDPAGPLAGQPVSVAHLDSQRCTRTGNAEYPVIYEDMDGQRYKLHYTRVLYAAQMPSPIAEMYAIGYSPVSRCINVAQNLIDVLTYKQEKMGSRPHRVILIPKGGLDPQDVASAFQLAENVMDAQGLTRYSKTVVVGSSTIPEAGMEVVELSSLPDGFDEETSTTLGMATIAMAFGMDARELWPAMQAGATRADAIVQHLKQRGKGPGQILQTTESLFNYKFLPTHLKLVFDFQDDAQDRQVADIRKVRAERRKIDMDTGAMDVRTMREQMLADGDIDRGQFEMMELRSGRLPNGASVLTLFFSRDELMSGLLTIPDLAQPLNIAGHDAGSALSAIRRQTQAVHKVLAVAKSERVRKAVFYAVAALNALEAKYRHRDVSPFFDDGQAADVSGTVVPSGTTVPRGRIPVSREQRRIELTNPTDRDLGNTDDNEDLSIPSEENPVVG